MGEIFQLRIRTLKEFDEGISKKFFPRRKIITKQDFVYASRSKIQKLSFGQARNETRILTSLTCIGYTNHTIQEFGLIFNRFPNALFPKVWQRCRHAEVTFYSYHAI